MAHIREGLHVVRICTLFRKVGIRSKELCALPSSVRLTALNGDGRSKGFGQLFLQSFFEPGDERNTA